MKQPCYRTMFKKDVKRLKRRRKDMEKLNQVAQRLLTNKRLPRHYKDHALIGDYVHHRECHIEPDWILIYTVKGGTVIFERTGSHADLFK